MTSLRDRDLCELIDQESNPEQRRKIAAELAGSPHLAERVALWRSNDAALRSALLVETGLGRRHPAEELLRRLAERPPSANQAIGDAERDPPYGGMALIAFGGGCFSALLAAGVMIFAAQ